jgi:hypothetical protein
MRNMLYQHDIRVNESSVAKWKYVKDFYFQDVKRKCRLAPKLTEKHVCLPVFGKMKVKLATQVLSHSVCAAIETYAATGAFSDEALGTAAFCSNMNELFDIFNSSRFDESVSARRPLSSDSNHFQLLDDHADWLKTVRVLERVTGKDITNRFKCINGWLQAINALKLLWDDISCSTKFLFTRRINQDSLENFFGILRQCGGGRDNPVGLEFMSAFKQTCVNNLLTPTTSNGNCEIDADKLLAVLACRPKQQCKNVSSAERIEQEVGSVLDPTAVSCGPSLNVALDLLEQNGLVYFSGFLLKRLLLFHVNCERCSALVDNTSLPSLPETKLTFMEHKQFSDGHLIMPCDAFVDMIACFEGVFSMYVKQVFHLPCLKETLIEHITKNTDFDDFCSNEATTFILDLFVRTRIYFYLKYVNEKLTAVKARKSRKAKKITHG